MMIKDPLVVLPINNFLVKLNLPETFDSHKDILTRDQIVSLLFQEKEQIQSTFLNDEYIALDSTNQEFIGIKSHTHIGEHELLSRIGKTAGRENTDKLSDEEALKVKISEEPKYKNSKIDGLSNVNLLYSHAERATQ